MEKIRILEIVPNMQSGGLENFIMNVYRNIDREKIALDFLVHYKEEKFFDSEIESLGGKIYRFSLREDNNIFKYVIDLNKFFKEHKEYKVIHCHMSSVGFLVFFIAKLNGIKVRIAHSHNQDTEKSLKGIVKSILMKPYKYTSTLNLACSDGAGKYLYKNKEYTVVNNGIDYTRFKFDLEKRKSVRKALGIKENEIVVGHVGRMNVQKNHIFLIEAFSEMLKQNPNCKLLLLGNGELEEKIKEKVKELKIEEKVVFLGVRKDTENIYLAMDVFVLPSLFEGLPLVAIEAQMSGLNCVFSENVTTDADISSNCTFAKLDKEEFAKTVIDNITKEETRSENMTLEKVKKSGFDIKEIAKQMETIYLNS